MKFKVPTFHHSGEKSEIDEDVLNEMDNKKLFEATIKSLTTWLFFWFMTSFFVYLILIYTGRGGNKLETTGYINLIFGGLLVYTNAVGGSSFVAGGGLVDHKIVMKDYVDSRVRVFTKWVGPAIGILFGILLVIISSV